MVHRFRCGSLAALAAAMLATAMSSVATEPADAGYPGANGPVAFTYVHDDTADIATVDPADGSGLTLLTSTEEWETSPSWSGDGLRVAFAANIPGRLGSQIFIQDSDGTNRRQLTDQRVINHAPSLSADGTRIAWQYQDPTGLNTIWVMNADGTDLRRLIGGPGAESSYPAWSPDGTQIAFNGAGYTNLMIADADGSNARFVMNGYGADWSPDGTRLAVAAWRTAELIGPSQIYTVDPDGSNVVQITDGPWYASQPAWSPDGTRIAFQRFIREGPDAAYTVWAMDTDGANATNLTAGLARYQGLNYSYGPSWRPIPQAPEFDFTGFFPPIVNDAVNVARPGRVIPVRFGLGGFWGWDVMAVGYPRSVPSACRVGTPAAGAGRPTDAAGGSRIRYSARRDRYTYRWKTERQWRGCRQLTVRLTDGTTHRATVRFER